MISDQQFMRQAIEQSKLALDAGEVPIGAVAVLDNKIIVATHNKKEARHDSTAHAEILSLQQVAEHIGNWRLREITIYVTLEPCPMCASALIQARVGKIVYGCPDPMMGGLGGKIDLTQVHSSNPKPEIVSGVLAGECKALLDSFFSQRRTKLIDENPQRT